MLKKTEEAIDRADIVIVVDEKNPDSFIRPFKIKKTPIIKVVSKTDLSKEKRGSYIRVSALKNTNIDVLLTELSTLIKSSFFDERAFFASERQVVLLEGSLESLKSLLDCVGEIDMVGFSSVLRRSVVGLEEVFGEIYNEDVLNAVFKGFCVGK